MTPEEKQAKLERIAKLMNKIMIKHELFSMIPQGSPFWALRNDLQKITNNDVSEDNPVALTDEDLKGLEAKYAEVA